MPIQTPKMTLFFMKIIFLRKKLTCRTKRAPESSQTIIGMLKNIQVSWRSCVPWSHIPDNSDIKFSITVVTNDMAIYYLTSYVKIHFYLVISNQFSKRFSNVLDDYLNISHMGIKTLHTLHFLPNLDSLMWWCIETHA